MYHCQADELLTTEHIQTFFQDCLEYPHWQQNKKILAQDIYQIIDWTCRQKEEVFDFDALLWPDQMQIITLELNKDWQEAVQGYLSFQHRGGEKFRILHDELLGKMVGLVLKTSGELLVRLFGPQFFIRHGALTPLREDLNLLYNDELELIEDMVHKIETGSYMTTRFFMKNQELYGHIVRGFYFQKLQDLNGENFATHARLFYCLKRIESHFLKRDSDPYYQNMADDLEHAVKMIRIGDLDFIQSAPEIISRAQNTLDYVFPNDKLLSLLLRDLQHTLISERRPEPKAPVKKTESKTQFKQAQTAGKQTERDMNLWSEQYHPISHQELTKEPQKDQLIERLKEKQLDDLIELTKRQKIPQTFL